MSAAQARSYLTKAEEYLAAAQENSKSRERRIAALNAAGAPRHARNVTNPAWETDQPRWVLHPTPPRNPYQTDRCSSVDETR